MHDIEVLIKGFIMFQDNNSFLFCVINIRLKVNLNANHDKQKNQA